MNHGLIVETILRKRVANLAPIETSIVANNNTTKTHRSKIPNDDISINPFNYSVSQRPNIIDSIDAQLQKVLKIKVGVTLSVEVVTPMKNDEITALLNSSLATIALSITDEKYFDNVDQSMCRLSLFISCSS